MHPEAMRDAGQGNSVLSMLKRPARRLHATWWLITTLVGVHGNRRHGLRREAHHGAQHATLVTALDLSEEDAGVASAAPRASLVSRAPPACGVSQASGSRRRDGSTGATGAASTVAGTSGPRGQRHERIAGRPGYERRDKRNRRHEWPERRSVLRRGHSQRHSEYNPRQRSRRCVGDRRGSPPLRPHAHRRTV